jgi:hypothetical protein
MEPTMQNNPNAVKNTIWITIGAIVIIILLIWAGVYMYNHRSEPSTVGTNGATSTNSTSTRYNLGEDDRTVTTDERAAVTTYLQTHINQLSTRKPAKGKTFTVDVVTVEAAGRAIVEYSDGSSQLAAAVSYSVDASGNIVINSFEILEK